MPIHQATNSAAGSSGQTDVSVDIGTGTDRKAILYHLHRGNASGVTSSGTFDPGGANEASMTDLTTNPDIEIEVGGTYYILSTEFYDIPDGLSGSQTFRGTSDQTGPCGAIVTIQNGCASGQPEAEEAVTDDTSSPTSVSDSITTITDGAEIISGALAREFDSVSGNYFTADNGQTERTEITLSANSFGGVVGDLAKATAGAQTVGWSLDTTGADGVAQVLIAIAPASGGTTSLPPIIRARRSPLLRM